MKKKKKKKKKKNIGVFRKMSKFINFKNKTY